MLPPWHILSALPSSISCSSTQRRRDQQCQRIPPVSTQPARSARAVMLQLCFPSVRALLCPPCEVQGRSSGAFRRSYRFSLFCSSKGTCCVELSSAAERRREKRQRGGGSLFHGGWREGGKLKRGGACSSAECITSLPHPVSLSVLITDMIFSVSKTPPPRCPCSFTGGQVFSLELEMQM